MMKAAGKRWWIDGWNWVDRAVFYTLTGVAASFVVGYVMRNATPSQWAPDVWSAIAAWVQALGSIAAIAAGVLTVKYQLSEQRREAVDRSIEAERSAKSRGYQVLASRLYICSTLVETIDRRLHDEKFSHYAALHGATELERVLREEDARGLTPAALAILGELVGRGIAIRAGIESCNRLEAKDVAAVLPALIQAVNALKSQLAIASRWLDSELKSLLSITEREELVRAANAA